MIRRSKSILKSIDILGDRFQLTHESQVSYSTPIGGCISLCVVIASLFLIFMFILEYFDTSKPLIVERIIKDNKYGKVDLKEMEEIRFFQLADASKGARLLALDEISQYVTLKMRITKFHQVTPNSIESKFSVYDLKPCKEMKNKFARDLLNNKDLFHFKNTSMCIDLPSNKPSFEYPTTGSGISDDDYYVQSNFVNFPFQKINILVYPCSLPQPSINCSNSLIIPTLSLISGKINTFLKPEKFYEPLSKNLNTENVVTLDYNLNIYFEERFRINIVEDERYDFLGGVEKAKFVDQIGKRVRPKARNGQFLSTTFNSIPVQIPYCLEEWINSEFIQACPPYVQFNWEASNEERIIERKYKVLLDTLGSIGGIFEIVAFIGGLFYYFYKNRAYNSFMRREVLMETQLKYKKYFEAVKQHDISKAMDKLIQDQKDASRVIKQLQIQNYLQDIFFKPRHRALIPLIALRQEVDKFEKNKQDDQKMGKDLGTNEISVEVKEMDIDQAIKELHTVQETNPIRKEIDLYFLDLINQLDIFDRSKSQIGANLLKSSFLDDSNIDLNLDLSIAESNSFTMDKGNNLLND